MIAVPVIAVLRTYGRGRGFSPFGVTIMQPTGQEIPALVDLGAALHGELGWVLLAVIAGHIAMVLVHRRIGEDVLPRMAGR